MNDTLCVSVIQRRSKLHDHCGCRARAGTLRLDNFLEGPSVNICKCNIKAVVIQARLNEIARRDPMAVLNVLEFWLGPESTDNADAMDG